MRQQTSMMLRTGVAALALAGLVVVAGVPTEAHHAFGAAVSFAAIRENELSTVGAAVRSLLPPDTGWPRSSKLAEAAASASSCRSIVVSGFDGLSSSPAALHVARSSDALVCPSASENPTGPIDNSASIVCSTAVALPWSGGQPPAGQPPKHPFTLCSSDEQLLSTPELSVDQNVSLLGTAPRLQISRLETPILYEEP